MAAWEQEQVGTAICGMVLRTSPALRVVCAALRAAPTTERIMPGIGIVLKKFATALPVPEKLTEDPAGGDSMYAPTLPTVRSVLISSGVKNACKRRVPICRMSR